MPRTLTMLTAAAALLLAAGCELTGDEEDTVAGEEAETEVTFDLQELNDSGAEDGTVTLTRLGPDETRVRVEVRPDAEPGDTESPPHPVHVHRGTCDELGEIAYPLEPVTDGTSTTTIDVGFDTLLDERFAVNVHKSEEEIGVYVACGVVP